MLELSNKRKKNMRYLPSLLLSVLAMGCSQTSDQMTRYHEDGMLKPVAVIAPMIDTTSFEVPWSVSEELTSAITSHMGQGKKIFVISKEDEAFAENPFGQDLQWIKKEFPNQEFAVFFELVQHETVPVTKTKKGILSPENASNLNITIRLRVVDVRGQTPKIVLQEIARETYFIPKTLSPTDYNTVTWGTPEYARSPMGTAHTQFARELANRVSDYILLAKSR